MKRNNNIIYNVSPSSIMTKEQLMRAPTVIMPEEEITIDLTNDMVTDRPVTSTPIKDIGRRHTACHIHTHLCGLLISVINSLFSTFQDALSLLTADQRSKIDAKLRSQLCPFQSNTSNWMKFAPNELEKLITILQSQTSDEDMADQASIDITKLSSRIVVLFNEYLKNVSFHNDYVESLTMHTHKLRIKRFSEAFFFQESSIVHLLAVYDPKYANPMYLSNYGTGRTPLTAANRGDDSIDSDDDKISLATSSCSGHSPDIITDEHALTRRSSATLVRRCSTYNSFSTNGHESLAAKVRESTYYKQLPPLPIECPDTDGQSHDQPIIIEEIFVPESRRSTTTADTKSVSSSSSGSDVDLKARDRKEGSIYKKKRCTGSSLFDSNKAIPVMRKINPNYNRKDLPIQEHKVNLVGYRSLDCSAFDDNVHRMVTSNGCEADQSDIITNTSSTRQGLGTLKCSFNNGDTNDLLKTDLAKMMSRSMPDLSHIDAKVRLRKNKTKKRSKSWICTSNNLSYSNCNLALPFPSSTEQSLLEDIHDLNSDKLTILEMLSDSRSERPTSVLITGQDDHSLASLSPNLGSQQRYLSKSSMQLSSLSHSSQEDVSQRSITFHQLKTSLMADLRPQFQGHVYSDLVELPASKRPYFSLRDKDDISLTSGLHYVICVHGLDGEHRDLRLVKAYLSLALPEQRFEFLMSEANEQDTFADINVMKDRLVDEIVEKIEELHERPDKISFIGHSLGCVLIRAAIASSRLKSFIPQFYTFLSLGGPHLGTVYGSSLLVNVGLWVMQKVRKSICLQQLSLKDSIIDLRQSYLYDLSGQPGLEYFKYVLLASSPQDRYVPYHSTRIELCRAAVRDNSEMGVVYMEMVTKLLQRLLRSGKTTVIRYDAHYTLPRSANNYIGRAAHIALIDSELFLEKFISVSAAKYFR